MNVAPAMHVHIAPFFETATTPFLQPVALSSTPSVMHVHVRHLLRQCALLAALLPLALSLVATLAHAGVTIEDASGVYVEHAIEAGCPSAITVGPLANTESQITTSETACDTGRIALSENPGANAGDRYTKLLVRKGVGLVGTIVLGKVTNAITCDASDSRESVAKGDVINFLRPRRLAEIKFPDSKPSRFERGLFYLTLHERCLYVKQPEPTPEPAAPVTKPPQTGAAGTSADGPAGTGNNSRGQVRISVWAWAGPLIAVGAIAMVGMVWCVVAKTGALSRDGYVLEEATLSETSDAAQFYGEEQGSCEEDGEERETVDSDSPRMRYSTDLQYFGPEPGQERRVSLGGPPTESETETDRSSSMSGR